MKTDTKKSIINRVISEEVNSLILTFSQEEVNALLAIGSTSQVSRAAFLNKNSNKHNNPENSKLCADLLGEIYFAAADFDRSQKLAGT